MKSRYTWFLFLVFIFLLSGCAHVISKDLRIKSDPSLTLGQVRQNPDALKEKLVIWGGEIIETVNQRDGTTQIEVFQRPLGWRGEPKETSYSEGRFLVLADSYLDPYIFRRGKRITVGGEIIGEKTKPLGEMEYRYPVVSSKQIYLFFGLNTITNPIPIIMTHGGRIPIGEGDLDLEAITTAILTVNLSTSIYPFQLLKKFRKKRDPF
ncbi:MAG: outer rane lipoprotein Slp [Deltaproteobacteria bacterium]|nr:outer rane lipoprotein Slp [Deltaproteobacteria bacterium]